MPNLARMAQGFGSNPWDNLTGQARKDSMRANGPYGGYRAARSGGWMTPADGGTDIGSPPEAQSTSWTPWTGQGTARARWGGGQGPWSAMQSIYAAPGMLPWQMPGATEAQHYGVDDATLGLQRAQNQAWTLYGQGQRSGNMNEFNAFTAGNPGAWSPQQADWYGAEQAQQVRDYMQNYGQTADQLTGGMKQLWDQYGSGPTLADLGGADVANAYSAATDPAAYWHKLLTQAGATAAWDTYGQ